MAAIQENQFPSDCSRQKAVFVTNVGSFGEQVHHHLSSICISGSALYYPRFFLRDPHFCWGAHGRSSPWPYSDSGRTVCGLYTATKAAAPTLMHDIADPDCVSVTPRMNSNPSATRPTMLAVLPQTCTVIFSPFGAPSAWSTSSKKGMLLEPKLRR